MKRYSRGESRVDSGQASLYDVGAAMPEVWLKPSPNSGNYIPK